MAKTQGVRFGNMEQTIVAAAGELFDRHGFNQTSLQNIANVLGMARPSLYHYFRSREQILAAGIELITEHRTKIIEECRAVEGDPVVRLTALVRGLGTLVTENPVWVRILLRDEAALPEDVRARDVESRMTYFGLLVDTLREGVELGFVRALDERATALTIISALTGLQGHYLATSDSSPTDLAHLAVDVVLHGVLNMEQRTGTVVERGLELIREGMALIERSGSPRDASIP